MLKETYWLSSGITINNIIIVIIECFYLKMRIIIIVIQYVLFLSSGSDGYIISDCPKQDLSIPWMSFLHCVFLFHRDLSLPSQCSHIRFTWVQRWHLSLWCRRGVHRQPVRCTSALPPPLSSCPSSALPSAISGCGIIECHFQSPEVM